MGQAQFLMKINYFVLKNYFVSKTQFRFEKYFIESSKKINYGQIYRLRMFLLSRKGFNDFKKRDFYKNLKFFKYLPGFSFFEKHPHHFIFSLCQNQTEK